MTGGGWSSARIDEIESLDGPGPAAWKPLRHHFGIQAFGVNAWVATEDGQVLIDEHDEEFEDGAGGHEEIYAITKGHATFTIDGSRVDAPEGTIVHVSNPLLVRSAVAEEAGTTVIAVGAAPGQAFEPSPWETKRVN